MINKNFLAMANFAMLSATGKCGGIEHDVDLKSVMKFASEQAVIPLVTNGIQKSGIYGTSHEIDALQQLTLQMVINNIKNGYVVKNIFEEYKKNNVNYAILKGESIAVLYNEPDLRISGDVDILVSKKDEKKALKILESFDYYYDKKPFWVNETIVKHNKHKMIEVHTSLFDESRNDIFFNNLVNEPEVFSTVTSENLGNISVLSPDDGIMFVFLHFVKHFLSSGAGIRQLIDVIVYSKHYKNEIDWKYLFGKLKEMRYYKLFEHIISIAVLYLGVSKNDLPEVELDVYCAEKVLCDLQSSGIFGYNEKELQQFKQVYEKKRFNSFVLGDYDLYAKKYKKSILKNLFPRMSYMKNRYGYIKKCPVLILVGYSHRIFAAIINIITKKRKMSDFSSDNIAVENEKINNRMKLMEELGLI